MVRPRNKALSVSAPSEPLPPLQQAASSTVSYPPAQVYSQAPWAAPVQQTTTQPLPPIPVQGADALYAAGQQLPLGPPTYDQVQVNGQYNPATYWPQQWNQGPQTAPLRWNSYQTSYAEGAPIKLHAAPAALQPPASQQRSGAATGHWPQVWRGGAHRVMALPPLSSSKGSLASSSRTPHVRTSGRVTMRDIEPVGSRQWLENQMRRRDSIARGRRQIRSKTTLPSATTTTKYTNKAKGLSRTTTSVATSSLGPTRSTTSKQSTETYQRRQSLPELRVFGKLKRASTVSSAPKSDVRHFE